MGFERVRKDTNIQKWKQALVNTHQNPFDMTEDNSHSHTPLCSLHDLAGRHRRALDSLVRLTEVIVY